MNNLKILHRRCISQNGLSFSNYSNFSNCNNKNRRNSLNSLNCLNYKTSSYRINIENIEKTEDGKYIYKNKNGGRDWEKTGNININTGFSFF